MDEVGQQVLWRQQAFRYAQELREVYRKEQATRAQSVRYAQELRTLVDKERAPAAERRRTAEGIRRVIEDGVTMVFQPICSLADARVVGFEALARFPSGPARTPDVWFQEAESVGLGIDLEIAAVAGALASFGLLPPDAYLSLNVSPETVVSNRFLEALERAPPDRIVIEVTEHAPVRDYGRLDAALHVLRDRGARLAVDDAGSGFASLRHILDLRPDIIKLDLSLTRNIDTDRARRAMASALISFASVMEVAIVAEGIESHEELNALRALGVACGQGYLLGRPGPLPPVA
jgi:EAL domain-containing protein (putative c-di-GMP-specific phosphodiesterase class I)